MTPFCRGGSTTASSLLRRIMGAGDERTIASVRRELELALRAIEDLEIGIGVETPRFPRERTEIGEPAA